MRGGWHRPGARAGNCKETPGDNVTSHLLGPADPRLPKGPGLWGFFTHKGQSAGGPGSTDPPVSCRAGEARDTPTVKGWGLPHCVPAVLLGVPSPQDGELGSAAFMLRYPPPRGCNSWPVRKAEEPPAEYPVLTLPRAGAGASGKGEERWAALAEPGVPTGGCTACPATWVLQPVPECAWFLTEPESH